MKILSVVSNGRPNIAILFFSYPNFLPLFPPLLFKSVTPSPQIHSFYIFLSPLFITVSLPSVLNPLLLYSSSLLPSLTSAAQKGLLHLSPDIYQEMEASRKQGPNAPSCGTSSGSSVNYMSSKDMGPCSAPLPPGHPPYYSGSASSPSPTATMARELLLNGQSPTIDTTLPMKGTNAGLACGVSVQPAQQLDYLARVQGFQVRAKTELMYSVL